MNSNITIIKVVACTVCGKKYNGHELLKNDVYTTITTKIICKECFKKLLGNYFDEEYGI